MTVNRLFTLFGVLWAAVGAALAIAFWGFVLWLAYKLVIHVTGAGA